MEHARPHFESDIAVNRSQGLGHPKTPERIELESERCSNIELRAP